MDIKRSSIVKKARIVKVYKRNTKIVKYEIFKIFLKAVNNSTEGYN